MDRKVEKAPLSNLKAYLPDRTFPIIADYLREYRVELTIKATRKSVLGDYRRPFKGRGHRISVNGDLNKYSFFITLIHELAHLLAFVRFGHHIKPHGVEWKYCFKNLMDEMQVYPWFPEDISMALQGYMSNPAARSCADPNLVRALRRYDSAKEKNVCLIEDLKEGEYFKISTGERFMRGRKLRKRYQCKSIDTDRLYVFSPLYEVKKISE